MKIDLGFEVGTGRKISVPLRHIAVTGRTQDSGKTTTQEALITRSGLRGVAFTTKRGEKSFTSGRIIPAYFQDPGESTDTPLWQFVASVLETALGERMKVQRSFIMQVCDSNYDKLGHWDKPRTLAGVAANVETALQNARAGFAQSIFRELREYFRIVIPQIDRIPKCSKVELKPGVNIMRLEEFPPQVQALIIASTVTWNWKRENNTVTIIPEAAFFLNARRPTPALLASENLIRQGGSLNNWLWIDSQDLAGVSTDIRRQVGVWILGVQGEVHEAKRTVDHLPAGLRKKPTVSDVQSLKKGQFFVTWGEDLHKVYVQPAWLNADHAYLVAVNNTAPPAPPANLKNSEDEMYKEQAEKAERDLAKANATITTLKEEVAKHKQYFNAYQRTLPELPVPSEFPTGSAASPTNGNGIGHSHFTRAWLDALLGELVSIVPENPAIMKLLQTRPELRVVWTPIKIELSEGTLQGKLALLVSEGFFDEEHNGSQAYTELKRRGQAVAKPNVYRELDKISAMGFLTKEDGGYKRVPGLKITKERIGT